MKTKEQLQEELLKSPGYHLTGVQIDDDEISVQYTVLCGGREYKTKLKKGDRVKVGCYCGVLILDSIDEIQTSIFNKLHWYTVTESYLLGKTKTDNGDSYSEDEMTPC